MMSMAGENKNIQPAGACNSNRYQIDQLKWITSYASPNCGSFSQYSETKKEMHFFFVEIFFSIIPIRQWRPRLEITSLFYSLGMEASRFIVKAIEMDKIRHDTAIQKNSVTIWSARNFFFLFSFWLVVLKQYFPLS